MKTLVLVLSSLAIGASGADPSPARAASEGPPPSTATATDAGSAGIVANVTAPGPASVKQEDWPWWPFPTQAYPQPQPQAQPKAQPKAQPQKKHSQHSGSSRKPRAPKAFGGRTIPTFKINLDQPPRQRWKEVALHYKAWFKANWEMVMSTKLKNNPWNEKAKKKLLDVINTEIREELEGFKEAASGLNVTMNDLLELQVSYEMGISMGFDCSGLLATKVDGEVMHGRNLDLAPQYQLYAQALYYAEFQKGGRTIARSVQIPGIVGVHTGIRVGHNGAESWTIEQNTRFEEGTTAQLWVTRGLDAIHQGAKIMSLEARQQLLNTPTFTQALNNFAKMKWIAPQYFIMGSSKMYQGAVITVGRAAKFYDIMTLSAGSGNWFLVQTNDDHFAMALDDRRSKAKQYITTQKEATDGNINEDDMMKTMRTGPVCNAGTIFTWICTPKTDYRKMMTGSCEAPY